MAQQSNNGAQTHTSQMRTSQTNAQATPQTAEGTQPVSTRPARPVQSASSATPIQHAPTAQSTQVIPPVSSTHLVADSAQPFVQVEHLSLRTPMGTVYEDVSFEVQKGQVACIFGEHGSGKTSLMLSVCGRMKPSKGTVQVGPYSLKQYRLVRRMSAISFIPDINDVQPFLEVKNIAAAELALYGIHGNKANTEKFLREWDFYDLKDMRFNKLDAYDEVRFGVILAMAAQPELLIVDDVQTDLTQHQSIKLVRWLKSIANAYGTTILFGCEEYEIAHIADGIVFMTDEAVAQRHAVLREEGIDLQHAVPVFGTGNGVQRRAHTTTAPSNPERS